MITAIVRRRLDATGFTNDLDRDVAIMAHRGEVDRDAYFRAEQHPDGMVWVYVIPSDDNAHPGYLSVEKV